jgi:hypothetical protein
MPRRSSSRRAPPAAAPPRRSPRGGLVVGLIVAGLTLAAVAILVARAISPAAPAPISAPTSAPAVAAPSATDACRALPAFTANPELGLEGGMALATDRSQMGLVLLTTRQPDQPYQHPTWDDAGFLGAIAYDRDGNIYVAPTPRLSLADNPLAGATTLWRVASASGEMAPFATLPGAASERNPFGALGLSYVCDLHRLYAGHVIGSTPTSERGGVVAIDLDDGALTPVLEETDVMGLLVVRVGAGYELYVGLARSPEVLALPLDARGAPSGPPRLLLDLTEAGATPSERARKLRLVEGELVADLVPFNYSLQTSAAAEPNRIAAWRFDPATGAWLVSRRATGP